MVVCQYPKGGHFVDNTVYITRPFTAVRVGPASFDPERLSARPPEHGVRGTARRPEGIGITWPRVEMNMGRSRHTDPI